MRNVEYQTRQGWVCHPVYEPAEAKLEGLEVLPDARAVTEQGQWFQTDDGFVVQVLRYGRSKSGKRWIRTCTGTFAIDTGVRVDTEPRESRFSFSGTQRRGSHFGVTDEMVEFAELVARGVDMVTAYMTVYPGTKDKRYAKRKALLLLKKKEVKRILDKKLGDMMDQLGITEEWILQNFKDLAEVADNDSVRLSSLNSLSKMRGMMDVHKKTETQVNAFVGISADDLKALRGGDTYLPVQAESSPEDCPQEDDDGFGTLLG